MRHAVLAFAVFTPLLFAWAAAAETSTYVDPKFGFTLHYPATAAINRRDVSPEMATPLDVSFNLTLPPAMLQPATNLREAALFIGVSADPAIVKSCAAPSPARGEKPNGAATIGGVKFKRFTLFDGAAGSMGESTIYRAVRAGSCYELTEFLFYSNMGAFTPGTVKPFDQAKVKAMLAAVTRSFAFVR